MKRATGFPFGFADPLVISIHALVKRATEVFTTAIWDLGISIHALVKRATTNNVFFPFSLTISIHALVKRATNMS